MLIDKGSYHAAAVVEVMQNIGALTHAVKILSSVEVVERSEQVFLQRLQELLDQLPGVVALLVPIRPLRVGAVDPISHLAIPVDITPAVRIQLLADLAQLPCNMGTPDFALPLARSSHIFKQIELPPFTDLNPTLDQELGVQRALSLPIQFLQPLTNLDHMIASTVVVIAVQSRIQPMERFPRLIQLPAQALYIVGVLRFSPSDCAR